MNSKSLKWILILIFLPNSFILGAHGYYGSDVFDILGILVGIFFLWGLVKIIERGNEVEEDIEPDYEIINHLLENNLPPEN